MAKYDTTGSRSSVAANMRFLDHLSQFLVAGPDQLAAAALVLRTQHVIHDFMAEVLWIADAGGLLHLLELGVQRGLVEGDTGGRVDVDLFWIQKSAKAT